MRHGAIEETVGRGMLRRGTAKTLRTCHGRRCRGSLQRGRARVTLGWGDGAVQRGYTSPVKRRLDERERQDHGRRQAETSRGQSSRRRVL